MPKIDKPMVRFEELETLALTLAASFDEPHSGGFDIQVYSDGTVSVYWATVNLPGDSGKVAYIGAKSGGGLAMYRSTEDEGLPAVGFGQGREPFEGVSWRVIIGWAAVIADLAATFLPGFVKSPKWLVVDAVEALEEFERTCGDSRADRIEPFVWAACLLLATWGRAGFPITEGDER